MTKSRKRHDRDSAVATSLSAAATAPLGNGGNHHGAPDPERISMRAYELYLARGGADGQAWDDWLEAERELSGERDTHSHGDSGE